MSCKAAGCCCSFLPDRWKGMWRAARPGAVTGSACSAAVLQCCSHHLCAARCSPPPPPSRRKWLAFDTQNNKYRQLQCCSAAGAAVRAGAGLDTLLHIFARARVLFVEGWVTRPRVTRVSYHCTHHTVSRVTCHGDHMLHTISDNCHAKWCHS